MKLSPIWLDAPEVQTLLAAFQRGGVELRFVGGCVRDTLMGRTVGDIDAATPAPPEAAMALLAAAGIRALPTGIKHGTVTALVQGRLVEITTLREDTACDGRHAEVRYTDDWAADAARRDFTLNALYLDAFGTLYDYGSGMEDAKAGRIRFIGDARARIKEDYLRILRFFRFYATHGTPPADADALAACAAEAKGIADLSGERIRAEMFKLLAAPHPQESIALMEKAGVLPQLLPCPAHLNALPEQPDPLLRLAALIQGGDGAELASRWRLSGAERKRLELALAPQPITSEATAKAMLRRYGRQALLDWLALNPQPEFQSLAENWQPPISPVTGKDLLERGIPAGQEMGAILKKLEADWENSGYTLSMDALLASV